MYNIFVHTCSLVDKAVFMLKHRTQKKGTIKSLGKSEAREQFLPLVDAVAGGAGPIEISAHGKVVAVLMSKNEYDLMKAGFKEKSAKSLCGLGTLVGNLEEGSAEIAALFQKSLKETAEGL